MTRKNFSLLLGFLIFLTFDLMILGAAVRTMDAGLTCPDWPLCFGKAVPRYHMGVYFEFIHRAVAGFVAILYFIAMGVIFRKKEFHSLRWLSVVGFLLLLSQIIMGGLTVLKLLAPGIVTMHLGLAGAFLISLIVLQHKVKEIGLISAPPLFKTLSLTGFVLVCAQILLGGWVASNYAGMVCVDFPTCNGEWAPAWTGPIGAQVIHRFGAYILALFFIFYFIYAMVQYKGRLIGEEEKRLSGKVFLLVISQISIGILNLKLLVPAWLTVIHLGLALYLMITVLKINLRLVK